MLSAFKSHWARKKESPFLSWIWLGVLFLVGIWLWGRILNFGDIPFDFHDWAEVNAPRMAFLKDAVTKGELPLHMPDASALRGITDRFMALPDVILSPQILLLRWTSVGTFILLDTWMLYAAGFWGLLKLRKRLDLSLLTFTWMFLLFNFNGHIIAHYAVGHITWGGYFLFPWFILLVLRLMDGWNDWRWVSAMAFLLFGIFLQGSFHQFVWMVIFLGFLAISNFKLLLPILKSGIAACLLSAVRIIPPAMQMGAFDDEFLGGYRTPIQLIHAFVSIIPPKESLNPEVTGATLGWWEFDLYTGIAGALFLFLIAAFWVIQRDRSLGFPGLLCPLLILSVFSVRNAYMALRFFRIPLFSGERVSARFLIVPVVFLLIVGCGALDRWLRGGGKRCLLRIAEALGLIPLAIGLWKNLETWKVSSAVNAFPYTRTDLSIKIVSNHPDPTYTTGLIVGCVITVCMAVLLIFLSRKKA